MKNPKLIPMTHFFGSHFPYERFEKHSFPHMSLMTNNRNLLVFFMAQANFYQTEIISNCPSSVQILQHFASYLPNVQQFVDTTQIQHTILFDTNKWQDSRTSQSQILVISFWYRSGMRNSPEQRVTASTLRRYSFVLRLAIAQADAMPVMPISFR